MLKERSEARTVGFRPFCCLEIIPAGTFRVCIRCFGMVNQKGTLQNDER